MDQSLLRVVSIYLAVAVLAGGIAYLGNYFGRKIGKMKMSLLRMRPRHTSIFLTTLMGIVTALFTLTLAAFLSEPVRLLLVGVDELRQEEQELQARIATLRDEVQRTRETQVVWGVGEKILQTTVFPADPAGVRGQLESAVFTANYQLIRRSNEIARRNEEEQLAPDTLLIDYDEGEFDAIRRRLEEKPEVLGLQIVVRRNSLLREPVEVSLEHWPVRRIASAGEQLVRGAVSADDFERSFYEFTASLEKAALERGMLPILENGKPSLGFGVTVEDYTRIQDEARRRSAPQALVAVANRDLYETSWLDVRIEVVPARSLVGEAR